MSENTFGKLFRFTSFGESHGPAIGCVVDGVPPRMALSEKDIQPFLDKRKPGTSRFVTQRREADKVRILSGVMGGKTTGAPVALLIENTDTRPKDYSAIAKKFRPGHADYTYMAKYGIRDHRGGGRSSARETACRVAAGAVARKVLAKRIGRHVKIRGAVVQVGGLPIDRARWNWAQVNKNPFFCPDAKVAAIWEKFLDTTRKQGSSAGAIIEVVAEGIPAGLGAPVYGKLDTEIAAAMMSINAVKGVEIGAGFALAATQGTQAGDEMRAGKGSAPVAPAAPDFMSNNAGGILGGISNGDDIICRFVVKPTSSILTPRRTITQGGRNTTIATKGRHDPCVGIRAVPIGEAMLALVLADHLMRHEGVVGG